MAKQDYYLEENNNYPNLTVNRILNRNGRGFTMEDNDIINTNKHRLIPESLATLNHLLSHSDTWHLCIENMNKTLKLSDYMSRKARAELEKKGFLEQIETRVNGRKAYKYIVYELPKEELKRINQGLENCSQQNDDNKLTEENAAHNNNEKQHEIQQNQSKLKEGNHICETKSSTNNSHSLKKNGDNMLHDSYRKHEINGENPPSENPKSSETQSIKASSTELREKRRKRAEELTLQFLNECEQIPYEIKDLLKSHIVMRTEKGIKTTPEQLKALYQQLTEECSTIEQQKKRILYATSCGYPTFVNKSNKKSDSKSNQPEYISSVEELNDYMGGNNG